MRVMAAIGLGVLFAIGALLGIAIGVIVFAVSLVRGARAVHAEGVVCRAVITSEAVPRLAGPALVRLSGAFTGAHATAPDVLGLAIRWQATEIDDAAVGDQDLWFATFESFTSAGRDRAATDAHDFLANHYSTVTPWWLPGHGPVTLRLIPTSPRRGDGDRLANLDAALADSAALADNATPAEGARLQLALGSRAAPEVIGELRMIARLAVDDRPLRTSRRRHGRGVRALGLRNGIRAAVYPMSQAARRLRGG